MTTTTLKTLERITELALRLAQQGARDPVGLAYDLATNELAQEVGCSCAGWASLERHQRRMDGHHESCPCVMAGQEGKGY